MYQQLANELLYCLILSTENLEYPYSFRKYLKFALELG